MKPKIMIQLNVVNYDKKLKQILLEKLKKAFEKVYGSQITVVFSNAQRYWKYPDMMECFFKLYSAETITVKEIIKLFEVEWIFKSGPTYDIETKKQVLKDESAIWNLHSQGGILLDENVEWAHIYTWD